MQTLDAILSMIQRGLEKTLKFTVYHDEAVRGSLDSTITSSHHMAQSAQDISIGGGMEQPANNSEELEDNRNINNVNSIVNNVNKDHTSKTTEFY